MSTKTEPSPQPIPHCANPQVPGASHQGPNPNNVNGVAPGQPAPLGQPHLQQPPPAYPTATAPLPNGLNGVVPAINGAPAGGVPYPNGVPGMTLPGTGEANAQQQQQQQQQYAADLGQRLLFDQVAALQRQVGAELMND